MSSWPYSGQCSRACVKNAKRSPITGGYMSQCHRSTRRSRSVLTLVLDRRSFSCVVQKLAPQHYTILSTQCGPGRHTGRTGFSPFSLCEAAAAARNTLNLDVPLHSSPEGVVGRHAADTVARWGTGSERPLHRRAPWSRVAQNARGVVKGVVQGVTRASFGRRAPLTSQLKRASARRREAKDFRGVYMFQQVAAVHLGWGQAPSLDTKMT